MLTVGEKRGPHTPRPAMLSSPAGYSNGQDLSDQDLACRNKIESIILLWTTSVLLYSGHKNVFQYE